PGSARSVALAVSYEEDKAQAYDRMQAFMLGLANYPDVVQQLGRFDALYRAWRSASEEVFSRWNAGDLAGAREQLHGPSLAAFEAVREMYNLAGEAADNKVAELESATLARVRTQQQIVGGFALLV